MQHDEQLPTMADEKKTIDLCGAQHDKLRCVRARGHDGPHEAFLVNRVEPLRWE